jgi:hypothetical protein
LLIARSLSASCLFVVGETDSVGETDCAHPGGMVVIAMLIPAKSRSMKVGFTKASLPVFDWLCFNILGITS